MTARVSIRCWAACLGLILATLGATAADSPFAAESTQQATEWTVSYKGRKLMVYAFAPEKYKPYVKELCTLTGFNVLRDAPSDHLHHHALMYAIRVNGLNFWEEISGSGVQKPVRTAKPELSADAQGRPLARLTQTIRWVAPQDAFLPDAAPVALLVEQRTLTLTVDETAREVALRWKSAFEVGPKTNQVTLTGSTYFGLGARFRQELDALARHLNSGGKPDLSGARQDVSRHKWGSVAFDIPGNPATFVIFGHPGNARGDACFFTMREGFPYLSATQGLDQEPLVYRSGERFQLNYLVSLYAELKSPEALNARGQQWESAKP